MSRRGNSHSDSRHYVATPHSGVLAVADSSTVRSPIRLVMIIAITVFFSETFEMVFFSFLPSFPFIIEAVIDATLLVLLISPVIYFFAYRPFFQQINNLDRTERALQKANLELEKRVDERTAELKRTNDRLKAEIENVFGKANHS